MYVYGSLHNRFIILNYIRCPELGFTLLDAHEPIYTLSIGNFVNMKYVYMTLCSVHVLVPFKGS